MTYHGGAVQDAPQVYVVYWGSQWGTGSITNDPSNEAGLQNSFFSSLHGSGDTWSTSVTQYCSGVAVGSTACGGATTFAGHPSVNPLQGTWLDDSAAAPSNPSASDIQKEAIRAAQHFGVTGTNAQIVVDSPTGVVPDGFVVGGGPYCAYHDTAQTSDGTSFTFTNFPYLTDAGKNCGAGYVAPGSSGVDPATEGITIVGGHEYGETVTDPIVEPSSTGWITDNDPSGGENGDKCAWSNGYSAIVGLNGTNFAVQSLWSNNDNNGSGGCVTYYGSASDQN
ncbi:hypothetical protein [Streptomyces sp. NPDC004296]|uniref:hypothetical protein n=1 Tax=Streptomyces sp. NPDC004296 TaxID=3364697 RepID=UPI00368EB818